MHFFGYRIAGIFCGVKLSWICTTLVICGKFFLLCIATFEFAASIELEGTACAKGPLGLGKFSFLLKYRYKAMSKCFYTCSRHVVEVSEVIMIERA